MAQSNEVMKFTCRGQGVNNMTGGCMGMCQERSEYSIEIMREVPGTDNFVTCVKLPGFYNNQSPNVPE